MTNAFCDLNMLLMSFSGSIILHKADLYIQLTAYKYGQIFISVSSETGRRETEILHNSFEKMVNKFNDKKWTNFDTSDTDFTLLTQLTRYNDDSVDFIEEMIMGVSECFKVPCSLESHWVNYSPRNLKTEDNRLTFLLDMIEFCLVTYQEEFWFKFDNNKIPVHLP